MLEKNVNLYFNKLAQLGLNVDKLSATLKEQIKCATFSLTPNSPLTGEGTLLSVVLYQLTPYALKLNDILPEDKRVDKNSLIKVCLLHQIAKAVRIIPNDNQWEIEKRGIFYKYDGEQPSIKTGLHSLSIAQSCDINFTLEEVEAMTINDRDLSDNQARFYAGTMASIVREASELVYLTNR